MTHLRSLALAVALAAIGALTLTGAASASLQTDRATFRSEAIKGIANAHKWWDSKRSWYDSYIHDTRKYPLATIWSVVPLFEAIDARAIDSPTAKNKQAVKAFAKKAEGYWLAGVGPHGAYAPYKGDRNVNERIWFDDNGWWGIAFADAYRATGNKRYITDAARALGFIATRGWAKDGGVWWDTVHSHKAGEALASGTALAALLFQATGNDSYRKTAKKFVSWADKHFVEQHGLYVRSESDPTPMGYVEGPMLGALEILCKKGDAHACARAQSVAEASLQRFRQDLNHAPQFDTIYLRWALAYYRATGDRRLYDLAYHNGLRVLHNARSSNGLYQRAWNGDRMSLAKYQEPPGLIQTHAANIALFAWLAAAPVPQGQ